MLNTAKNTTETIYEYNEYGKMSKKTVIETCDNDNTEIETGIELESTFGMSPLEIFLTATTGALVGNLLYRVIRKD